MTAKQRPAVVARVRRHKGHALNAQRLPPNEEVHQEVSVLGTKCQALQGLIGHMRSRHTTSLAHCMTSACLTECPAMSLKSLAGGPSTVRRAKAHPRVSNLLQQGADMLCNGVAGPRGVQAARHKRVDAPYWAAAEHEGHPGPVVVLRCGHRRRSQFGQWAAHLEKQCDDRRGALAVRGSIARAALVRWARPWCPWHSLQSVHESVQKEAYPDRGLQPGKGGVLCCGAPSRPAEALIGAPSTA